MGFVPLPEVRTPDERKAWISLGDSGGYQKRRMTLYLRPTLFGEVAASWFTRGKKVVVLVGTGMDAGALRIEPGGDRPVLTTGGPYCRGGIPVVRIFLPVPPDAPSTPMEVTTVEAEVDGDGIVFRLPSVLVVPTPAAREMIALPMTSPEPPHQVTIPARPAPSRSAGFSMISGVPDPAAVLQSTNGGRVR